MNIAIEKQDSKNKRRGEASASCLVSFYEKQKAKYRWNL